jgi:hypothetical protein
VNIEFHQSFVSHFQEEGLAGFLVRDIGALHDFVGFERLFAKGAQDILSIIQHFHPQSLSLGTTAKPRAGPRQANKKGKQTKNLQQICKKSDPLGTTKNPARREARRSFSINNLWIELPPLRHASGDPWRPVARVALEEQGLAGDGGHHRGLERF